MVNRYMKVCLTSLAVKEMRIKTPMGYHITPFTMAAINKIGNNKRWRGYRGKRTFIHSISIGSFLQVENNEYFLPKSVLLHLFKCI